MLTLTQHDKVRPNTEIIPKAIVTRCSVQMLKLDKHVKHVNKRYNFL